MLTVDKVDSEAAVAKISVGDLCLLFLYFGDLLTCICQEMLLGSSFVNPAALMAAGSVISGRAVNYFVAFAILWPFEVGISTRKTAKRHSVVSK